MNAYERITNQIIGALEEGHIPWEKPWVGQAGMPQSIHGRAYRGVNAFWLGFVAHHFGYSDPRWLTFNAAKKLGGKVRNGEKSQAVTLWLKKYSHVENCPTGKQKNSDQKACGNLKGKKSNLCSEYFYLRYYNVFNVEQVDDLDIKPIDTEEFDFDPIAAAEDLVGEYLDRESIPLLQGGEAFYQPASDSITMPKPTMFKRPEAYYTALFHECAHSTGHSDRLNRKGIEKVSHFGSENYAKEELVAEMGSAFLGGHTGVENVIEDRQRVAYIQSWLKVLKNDSRLVVNAASQAQRAAEYIIG